MILIVIGFVLNLFVINLKFCNGIFNGWYAEPGEYPFAVCLVDITKNIPKCVGMIVTEEKILTTAHCLDNKLSNMKVIAGVLDITEKTSDYFQESNITEKKIHSKYKRRQGFITLYNIGTATLEKRLTFTETVKPLVIVSNNEYRMQESFFSYTSNKDDCFTFGWGSTAYDMTNPSNPIPTNYSMKLKVAGVMPEEYEKCSSITDDKVDLQSIGVVCAIATAPESLPCAGDGGGGLVCGGRKHVYALLTESRTCSKSDSLVYLLFSQYINEFGLDHNADFAIRNVHVANHIPLIVLSACLFSWYFHQPYP